MFSVQYQTFLTVIFFVLGTKRVHNNIVYNEYIGHREHIHMNATQWETLTDFTKWLGREGNFHFCKPLLERSVKYVVVFQRKTSV